MQLQIAGLYKSNACTFTLRGAENTTNRWINHESLKIIDYLDIKHDWSFREEP